MSKDESWGSQPLSSWDSVDSESHSVEDGGETPYHPVAPSVNGDGNGVETSQSVSTYKEESNSSEPPLNSEEDSKRSLQPIISSENDDGNFQIPLSAMSEERDSILQNFQGGESFQQPTSSGNDDDRSNNTHPVSPSLHQASPTSGNNTVGDDSISTSLANGNVNIESLPVSADSPPTHLADGESPPTPSFGNCESSYSQCSSINEGNSYAQASFVDGSPDVSRNGDPILGGLNAVPTFADSDFFIQPEDVQLSEEIGVGAFSHVYVGMYMGELVAVKKQKWVGEKNKEVYLLRELAVLKHFEHPNLLRYIGASKVEAVSDSEQRTQEDVKDEAADDSDNEEECDSGSYVYIVTELAVHGDLLALLMTDSPLGWCLRCNILMDTARALEFLHNKSLIHRDVKSANMILCNGYTCKLADFGMARQLGSDMTVVGTDAYMAPELLFDEPYDGLADMFSFGIVMWECIHRHKAGADGWAERRPNDKFHLSTDDLVATSPTDTPRSVMMLAQQLCSYEPEERLTSEDTFLWLEDLIHEMEPDEIIPPEPIDYMHIFKNGVTGSSPKNDRVSTSTLNESVSNMVCNSCNNSKEGSAAAEGTSSTVAGYVSRVSPDQPPELNPNAPTAELAASDRCDDVTMVSPRQEEDLDLKVSTMSIQENKLTYGGRKEEDEVVALSTICQPSHYSTSLDTPPCCDDLKDEHLRAGRLVAAATELMHNSPSGVQGTAHMPITCRGFLFKKGKTGLRNWQKRWFVLEGSRLVWYKSIDGYPWEPRGFLELRGCFLVRGLYFKWKILSIDNKADQEEYNRELAAISAVDMEMWLKALQAAIDDADAVRDDSHNKLNKGSSSGVLPDASNYRAVHSDGKNSKHRRILSTPLSRDASTFRYNLTVGDWLNGLDLSELLPSFQRAGYTDMLLLMDLGLRDDDLDAIGINAPHIRKALKMNMPGFKAVVLTARITGYFDFGKEVVYRVESKWQCDRSNTFFTFQDFEEMHKKLRAAVKEPKHQRLLPSFPSKLFVAARGRKLGTFDHATTMARRQTSLNKYLQTLIELVGFREPYFTIICVALKVSQGSV